MLSLIAENTPGDKVEDEQRGESASTIMTGQGLVEASKGMASEASETLVQIRGRVMEKLSSLHLPSESLEAVRKTFETGLKGAYTTTVDAVQRTKQSLLDILPASLAHTNANEARRVSLTMLPRGRFKTAKSSHYCVHLFQNPHLLQAVPRSL